MPAISYKNSPEHCRFANTLRKAATLEERLLWNALCELRKAGGPKFRRQHPLHPYIVDFACIKARLVIELDGASHDARQVYDHERDANLYEQGWTVMRFTNEDVCQNLDGVVLTIMTKIQECLALEIVDASPSPDPSRAREGDAKFQGK